MAEREQFEQQQTRRRIEALESAVSTWRDRARAAMKAGEELANAIESMPIWTQELRESAEGTRAILACNVFDPLICMKDGV